jgi:hypothetical protein
MTAKDVPDTGGAAFATNSLRASAARVAGALAVPCAEHCAAEGDYCWGPPDSPVRAVCLARYRRGVEAPARLPEPFMGGAPDGLAARAAAVRNASLHDRQREQAGGSLRRHPNRHPAQHVPAATTRRDRR